MPKLDYNPDYIQPGDQMETGGYTVPFETQRNLDRRLRIMDVDENLMLELMSDRARITNLPRDVYCTAVNYAQGRDAFQFKIRSVEFDVVLPRQEIPRFDAVCTSDPDRATSATPSSGEGGV